MRFILALLLGYLLGSLSLWGAGEIPNSVLSNAIGLTAIFIVGFIGMVVAKQRPVLYAFLLAVVPLLIIFASLAIQRGDPVVGVILYNWKQIVAPFAIALAGSAAASYATRRSSLEYDRE